MITLKLTRNNAYPWCHKNEIYAKGYCFTPDGKLHKDADLCTYFENITTEGDFRQKLLSANGTFSVIIKHSGLSLWMAVDRYRYFPLYYRKDGNDLIIGDEIDNLYKLNESKAIDESAYLSFRGLGYVTGNKTLLKDTFQIQSGEYLVYSDNRITPAFYHQHFSEIADISFDEAKKQLKNILLHVGQRISLLLDGRPAILSLSGGFDSRLIAYLLKKEGIKNVLCFTYGKKEGNPEWKRSQMVAEKLGFNWLFIDYTTINEPEFHKQQDFIDFSNYACQYVSKFGVVAYFAAKYLTEELKIPANSVYIPGHGGDFFSGRHLRPYMQHYTSVATIAKDLQISNFHIGGLVQLTNKERKKIETSIHQGLENKTPLFHNIENWELKERETKYVFNFNKLWEYYGIDSHMPLCDTEFMDFFIQQPFEYRLNQKLYKTVLSELFAEFDINFPQDVVRHEATWIQQLKIWIKRTFPFLKKKNNVFMFDYFDFQRISQPIQQEVATSKEKRKVLSSNGFFSEWYLLQVKKNL